jgi:hypothetical protein
MPRRRNYDLEALLVVSNVDCPHCRAVLGPAEYMRLDGKGTLRCLKCGKDFEYQGKGGTPMRTS